MPDRETLEATFLAHLEWIDRVVAVLARRHGLDREERDDLASWVKLRLVEDDYAILAKFRGASTLTTYLTTVIAMLYRDYRAQRWGRWRPSAAALKQGALAVRLERLVMHDALSVEQAGELLRTRGETTLSDRQLWELLATLPRRAPLRPFIMGDEALRHASGLEPRIDPIAAVDAAATRHESEAALARALAELPPEDQLILQMHFWKGATVADIARALHVQQRPLYRRLDRLLTDLRRRLEAAGVTRDQARELLDEPAA